MNIRTKRLSICKATLRDSSFIFELLNSPNWIEFIGDRGINTIEDAEAYIENSLISSYTTLGFGLYKVTLRENGQAVGISGFLKRDYLEHPDLGFATLPEFEGRGYSFEAADALMKFGMQELELKTIYAITSHENLASQNLLAKLGLKAKGIVLPPGEEVELLLYST
ncbi:MAG: GNAT family N-acetyltransferase [Cyclobacteriaceae bacterium]